MEIPSYSEDTQRMIREVFGSSSDEDHIAEEGDGSSNDEQDTEIALVGVSNNDFIRGRQFPEEVDRHAGYMEWAFYRDSINLQFYLNSLTLASAKIYEARYVDFFQFWNVHAAQMTREAALLHYFKTRREETKPDRTPRYAGSVFNGWFAMFHKLYQMCGLGVLTTLVPALSVSCKKWKKSHRIKKSAIFPRGTCL